MRLMALTVNLHALAVVTFLLFLALELVFELVVCVDAADSDFGGGGGFALRLYLFFRRHSSRRCRYASLICYTSVSKFSLRRQSEHPHLDKLLLCFIFVVEVPVRVPFQRLDVHEVSDHVQTSEECQRTSFLYATRISSSVAPFSRPRRA